MTKLKKIKAKLVAVSGLAVVLVFALVLGVSSVVSAFSSDKAPKIVNEAGGIVNFNEAPEVPVASEDEVLGSTNDGLFKTAQECWGGDCTYHFNGPFIDASTTIVSIPNPFLAVTSTNGEIILTELNNGIGMGSATATVSLVRLQVSAGGTANSRLAYGCASAPNSGATSTNSMVIIDTGSTTGTPYVESGISSSSAYYSGLQTQFWPALSNETIKDNQFVSNTPIHKIFLTPELPYLICNVFGKSGVSTTGNTFDGSFTVRIERQR